MNSIFLFFVIIAYVGSSAADLAKWRELQFFRWYCAASVRKEFKLAFCLDFLFLFYQEKRKEEYRKIQKWLMLLPNE